MLNITKLQMTVIIGHSKPYWYIKTIAVHVNNKQQRTTVGNKLR